MTVMYLSRLAESVSDRRSVLCKLAAMVGAGLVPALSASEAFAASPAAVSLPALRRGINLTHWFEYERGQAVSAAEMVVLRQRGMDHVRIPVDPVACGWRMEVSGAVPFLPTLRTAIEQALAASLDVVVDLHLEPSDKQKVESRPELERHLLTLWSVLSRELGRLPAEHVVFELLNEPQYYGWQASRWPVLQQRLLQTVRANAPRNLVLLSGNEGGSLKGLRSLPLVSDAAVAYVFHYYDPFLFTHQGAHWLDTRYTTAGLRNGVRYPAAFQIQRPAALSRPHPRAEQEMASYVKEDWGPQRVRKDMDGAGGFARSEGVRLVCNEFGAIRANVDSASRYRWMADVRNALEANGIGWTLWDYTDIFGITAESSQSNRVGNRTIELDALQALGLTMPGVLR